MCIPVLCRRQGYRCNAVEAAACRTTPRVVSVCRMELMELASVISSSAMKLRESGECEGFWYQ